MFVAFARSARISSRVAFSLASLSTSSCDRSKSPGFKLGEEASVGFDEPCRLLRSVKADFRILKTFWCQRFEDIRRAIPDRSGSDLAYWLECTVETDIYLSRGLAFISRAPTFPAGAWRFDGHARAILSMLAPYHHEVIGRAAEVLLCFPS